jgi:hypothetical protein
MHVLLQEHGRIIWCDEIGGIHASSAMVIAQLKSAVGAKFTAFCN